MMKKAIVIITSLSMCMLARAQSTLYVKTKDGTQTGNTLSGIKKLTFPTGSVAVSKTNGTQQSYVLSTVRYLSFADYPTDAPLVETQDRSSLKLYPNPASNELSISYQAPQTGMVQLRIVDLQGHIVLEQQQQSNAGKNETTLNISSLPSGLYLLSNGIKSTEFIIK